MPTTLSMQRRMFLGATASAGTAAMVARPALSANARLDPADPANKDVVFRKLAYSLGQDFGCWWLKGVRYALIDAELTPLWDMHFGALFKVRDLPDGTYEVTNLPVSFYTDLNTGAFLQKFTNPLSGKTVDMRYYPISTSKSVYRGAHRIEAPVPGGSSRAIISPASVDGGRVWMREDHLFEAAPDKSGHRFRVNDLSTYFASTEVMADPNVTMAPAGQIFSDILNWPEWLGMGDRQGVMYSRTYGQKVARLDDTPTIWRELLRQHHPDVYADPLGALKG